MQHPTAGLMGSLKALGPAKIMALITILLLVVGFAVFRPMEAALYLPLLIPVFGAVTVAFENPVQGAVAPTAAQALLTTRVTFNIIATADADATSGAVSHNFNIAAGPGPTGATLANGAPIILLEPLIVPAALASMWFVTAKAANTVTLGKTTAVGSGNAGIQERVHVLHHSTLDC